MFINVKEMGYEILCKKKIEKKTYKPLEISWNANKSKLLMRYTNHQGDFFVFFAQRLRIWANAPHVCPQRPYHFK